MLEGEGGAGHWGSDQDPSGGESHGGLQAGSRVLSVGNAAGSGPGFGRIGSQRAGTQGSFLDWRSGARP